MNLIGSLDVFYLNNIVSVKELSADSCMKLQMFALEASRANMLCEEHQISKGQLSDR